MYKMSKKIVLNISKGYNTTLKSAPSISGSGFKINGEGFKINGEGFKINGGKIAVEAPKEIVSEDTTKKEMHKVFRKVNLDKKQANKKNNIKLIL
jgi:hypothetical protein